MIGQLSTIAVSAMLVLGLQGCGDKLMPIKMLPVQRHKQLPGLYSTRIRAHPMHLPLRVTPDEETLGPL